MSGTATAAQTPQQQQTPPTQPVPSNQARALSPMSTNYLGLTQQALARLGTIRMPPPPKLQALPQPPAYQPPQSPLAGLQNWGTVLAMLGSLLTRAPLTSAIRAAAGSMQAYAKGNQQAYQYLRQQFSENLQRALQQNKQELQTYQALMDNAKFDLEGTMAQIKGYAALNHDKVMMQQTNARIAAQLMAIRMQAGARLEAVELQVRQNEENNKIKLIQDLVAQGGNVPVSVLKQYGLAGPQASDPKPGDLPAKPAVGTDGVMRSNIPGVMSLQDAIKSGSLSPALETTAYAIANYAVPMGNALSSFGGNNAARARVVAEVMRINPKFNAKIYGMQSRALDYYASGQGAQLIRSYSTAVYHMDSLRQLVDALGNTNQPMGNFIVNWARRAFGNPNITNFDVAKALVAGELTTALRGTQGAESDIERFEKELSPNMTPAQLKGALATVAKLLAGRLNVIDSQIKTSTGMDIGSKLIPAVVRKSLADLENGTRAAPKAAVGAPPASALKRGVYTTFANGQTWTLGANGTPQRVQ